MTWSENILHPANADASAGLLADYTPLDGLPDELLDADGQMRPVWRDLISHLARHSPEALEAQFARGASYLREAGVFYRQYGGTGQDERDWPLDPIPVLLSASEWSGIESALKQRADLLEAVLADLYGENRLTREGHLPARLIAANPEWLRPLVGVRPASGHHLHFIAFDIGRRRDGRWWVLGDRTQAPSGAGYALENRMASLHSFAGFYRSARVQRIAEFFKAFRDSLNALSGANRAGILTPGPMNDGYFEHAYIARYLGLPLLEGEDLTVSNGELMVRTISGLQPIGVLWRRMDANWADPQELEEASQIGTPGLVAALRNGQLSMVNSLGAGVLEARAFLAFLPRLSEILLGAPLAMPNVATWWCGSKAERDHVSQNAASLMIGPANAAHMTLEPDPRISLGGENRSAADQPLAEWLESSGADLVGQEVVRLSTTPVWADGRLQPRAMTLRVFLARTEDGWQAMPGGYARIAAGADPSAVSLRRGGSVADVWVASGQASVSEAVTESPPIRPYRPSAGLLPGRAADNLFWLGRYIERAEGTMRLLRAYHGRLDEMPDGTANVLTLLETIFAARDLGTGKGIPDALVEMLSAATGSAGRLRDRFSVDAWSALADLQNTVKKMRGVVQPGDDAALALGVLLRKIAGFTGLVHENMYRFSGWRFLTLGRSVERALATTRLLLDLAGPTTPEAYELCIEVADSVMTHRRRYSVHTSRASLVDLIALDPLNPRSVAFHAEEIREQISLLPGAAENRQLSPLARTALRLSTDLAVHTTDSLDPSALSVVADQITALSEQIEATYFHQI
ncbi:circularly permuted type 2 ATP-grasp protein [Pseudohoeflea coraliihabitans]|uniref:Circularly permuted type 2 ATP-grasp protein n=1 Tax=Pseudohoeflea coraliihabitans TaxID=2860393 RepID=A0ABS6WM81_9HYPH|nr:circularly permuted type 2 ATP-grasp protein [Pseudohoeflea sp. DP4N28-3]MBW3097071.1 circularly permuted type 2 ATP-grasp protein [Pseudohoeflea sp. DP4N28-3]